jgi:hypothetical protein
VPRPRLSEYEYLRQLELLATDIVNHAQHEGWLSYLPDPADATAVQRAVNELARQLRHHHFPGDGCLDDESPPLHLAGAYLLTPGTTDTEQASYRARCATLGVEPRDDGWGLWHTWDHQQHPHSIVTTALDTTQGLLDNWSHGHDLHPARPHRSQIAAVVSGWTEPMILSPGYARMTNLGGH